MQHTEARESNRESSMTSKEKAVIAEHRQLARAIKAIERNLRKHKEQIVGLPGWGKAFRPLRKVFDGLLELKSTLDDELARETSRQVWDNERLAKVYFGTDS